MLFWENVGNGILLDRPLPFKLHQSYRLLPCFIREFNPASHEIWSNPAERRPLALSCKYLAKKCGDDLNTAVGFSLPRWCDNAVIVTAIIRTINFHLSICDDNMNDCKTEIILCIIERHVYEAVSYLNMLNVSQPSQTQIWMFWCDFPKA